MDLEVVVIDDDDDDDGEEIILGEIKVKAVLVVKDIDNITRMRNRCIEKECIIVGVLFMEID